MNPASTRLARAPAAARLYRQASEIVVGRTRAGYARDPEVRAEFDRFRHTHSAFVSAAWMSAD
jgi:hypothetical protein